MSSSPGAPRLEAADVRTLVGDPDRLKRGAEIFKKGGVLIASRFQSKLFAEVRGSEPWPYRMSVELSGPPLALVAKCTCKDAESSPVCKHAAALLVAWSRSPGSFVVSETAPSSGTVSVKLGKTSAVELIKSGIEQVDTLLHELGVTGVSVVVADRIEQIRRLGESFRESDLERLSGLTMDFAHLLETYSSGQAGMASTRYADLMTDMLLTIRKLRRYSEGEPLEDRYVEELIGRAWRDADASAAKELRLVEVSFTTRRTTDDYIVRESRFIDIMSGAHYREEQAVRSVSDLASKRKVSYAGSALVGASGGVYPGFPPLRIRMISLGEKAPLGADDIRAIEALASPDVASVVAALQEHRRDVLAPDVFPVVVRARSLIARGDRLLAVDEKGDALHLCDEPRIEEQLGEALHDGRLCALVGDIGLDAAIPTLWPLASIIEGPLGVELRTIHDEPSAHRGSLKKRGLSTRLRSPAREASLWSIAAREAGISPLAIAVGELREDVADCLVAGLAGMSPRAIGSIAPRLRDLSFERHAALLEVAARRPDPASRLSEVIKVYHGLGSILVKLAGATPVDMRSLANVAGYESLHVARPARALSPQDIERGRAMLTLNRYEAVLHYARHFEELPPEAIQAFIYPAWADGSVGPYVARAFAARGLLAIEAAEGVLSEASGRMAKFTAIGVLAARASRAAEDALTHFVASELDPALRVLAEDALDGIDIKAGRAAAGEARRAALGMRLAKSVERLLTEPQKEKRRAAIQELCDLGHRGAIRSLRQAFVGDAAYEVREEAAYALARLGDTYMVETFVRMMATRRDEGAEGTDIDIAARALGLLGDARGASEVVAAFVEGYSQMDIAEALRSFGAAAMDPLIRAIEARPEVGKRLLTLSVFERMPATRLGESLARRISATKSEMSGDVAGFLDRVTLYLKLGDVQSKSRKIVARAIVENLSGLNEEGAKALLKTAQKALGVV